MDHDSTADCYKPEDIEAIMNGAQVLLDDLRHRVVVLKAAAAASWWGRGTRWCTADPAWFQTYHQHGDLIYIEDCRTRLRWQFQFWRCELRNWRNRRADPLMFARRYPAVLECLKPQFDRDFRARFFFGLVQEGEIFDHSLNLSGVRLRFLPSGLGVRDDLDVTETGLTALPKGLKIGGDLYISGHPLLTIPGCLSLRGRKYMRGNP